MPICTAPEGYLYAQDGPCPGQIVQTTSALMPTVEQTMDLGTSAFGWDEFLGGNLPGGGSWGVDFPSLPNININVGGGSQDPLNVNFSNVPGEPQAQIQTGVSGGICPTGYHVRKGKLVLNRPNCVRNRKMNSLNPDALKRATRRLSGFFTHVKSAEKAVRHSLGSVAKAAPRRGCNYCGKSGRACRCG